MTWIACAKRLPKPEQTVLLWLPRLPPKQHLGIVEVGYLYPSGHSWDIGEMTLELKDVSHWMPRPKPPPGMEYGR